MNDHHKNRSYRVTADFVNGKRDTVFSVGCSKCTAELRLHLQPTISVDGVGQKIRNRGWRYSEKNAFAHLCPDCLMPPRKSAKEKAVMVQQPGLRAITIESKPGAARTGPAPVAPGPVFTAAPLRDATMPEIRRILALVEGHFDEAKGAYTGNFSDQRVADELDLPRALVAKVREDTGLKLKVDPEIAALATELAALREMIDAFDAKFAKFRERMGR